MLLDVHRPSMAEPQLKLGGFVHQRPVEEEAERDPTWNEDAIGNWSSSSDDDEEESGMDVDEVIPPVVSDAIPQFDGSAATSEPSPRVRLSELTRIVQEQKRWIENHMKTGRFTPTEEQSTLTPVRRESTDSDSSLASIPAIAAQPKETPVPLPPTVANTAAAGTPSTPAFGQSGRASLPPPPVAKGPSFTPTPVPLPSAIDRSASASFVNGLTMPSSAPPKANLPALRAPPSSFGNQETWRSGTPSGKLSASSYQVLTAALSRPNLPMAVEFAGDGMPYSVYCQPDGELTSARGALIPAGYQLHDDPVYPFICPIRSCRRTLKTLMALGGHFGAGHKNLTFNDNGDGTLSQVGTYKNPAGSSPAIVISRNPLSDKTSALAIPRLSDTELKGIANKRQLQESSETKALKRRALSGDHPGTGFGAFDPEDVSVVFKYMGRINYPGHTHPYRPDISAMAIMPQLRNLPTSFIEHHQGTILDHQTYACAVAYITGVELSGPLACHAATGIFARLSDKCIVLPRLSQEQRNSFCKHYICVGCAYLSHATGQPDHCSLNVQGSATDINDGQPVGVRPSSVRPMPVARSSQPASPWPPPGSLLTDSPKEQELTLASRRPVRQSVLNRLQMDKESVGNRGQAYAAPPSLRSSAEPERAVAKRQTQTKSPSVQPNKELESERVAGMQPGQFGTPDYEMEDWEIAPGRVTSEDTSRNVAYSGAFLTSSTPITISPDICFNVLTIRPGQIFNVDVKKDKMQVFSVASGKVRVTTGGKMLQLGPNGAFPVRPGETCVIENRIYFEAMVHCTTVKDYELA